MIRRLVAVVALVLLAALGSVATAGVAYAQPSDCAPLCTGEPPPSSPPSSSTPGLDRAIKVVRGLRSRRG